MPASFTATLDAGRSIGGIVVDEQGNPIAGARVHPNIRYKKRPGDTASLGIGSRLTTNEFGEWTYHSVPDSMSDVFVEITHPEFMPARMSLPLDGYGLIAAERAAKQIVMHRGLTVTGIVIDPDGNPVSGAVVRTKFLNDIRETRTDDDGVYRLTGCEPVSSKIVVSADGLAVAKQELRIAPDMPPVDFVMKPGGHVRIRVIDEQGNPIPKARVFFQGWGDSRYEYFEFDHVDQYTDQNGVWEWNEAPVDEFRADICRPGGMQLSGQSLIAREQEYVFEPPPLLVITGAVVDAESGDPIEKFRVVPGIRSSPSEMNWVRDGREGAFDASNGKFRFSRNYGYFAHLVRIEAPGYLPAISRDIKSDEGSIELKFELKRGHDVAAQIITPDGHPASGAAIALGIADSQISVSNGRIDDGSTYAARSVADEQGRFLFPSQDSDYQLVITHPTGYAHIKATAEQPLNEIRLTAWARVEGTFRVAGQPASGVPLTVDSDAIGSYGRDVAHIFTNHEVTTGSDGHFVLERVLPGKGWISRRIMMTVSDGAGEVTSALIKSIDLPQVRRPRLNSASADGRSSASWCRLTARLWQPPGASHC